MRGCEPEVLLLVAEGLLCFVKSISKEIHLISLLHQLLLLATLFFHLCFR